MELLQKHKKPIMGYSDTTAILTYFSQFDIPCYYGPTIMAGFAQMHLYPEWFEYVNKVLAGEELQLEPFAEYNNGYQD